MEPGGQDWENWLELGMRGKTIVDTPEGWQRFFERHVRDAIKAERAKLKEVV